MIRTRPNFDWRAAFVGGVVVALLVATAPVVADIGDPVLIGRYNQGDQRTTLTGTVSGDSALRVVNKATDGTGITVRVAPGQAPFVVNSSQKVRKLNADRVDGLSSEHLSPKVITAIADASGLDLSISPYICETATYTATRKELAIISTNVAIGAPNAGAMQWGTKAAYTVDGGPATFAPPNWWLRVTSEASEYNALTSVGVLELEPGSTYTFGVTARQFSGETITGEYICKTIAEISPRVSKSGDITQSDAGASAPNTSNN
ncbi:MAG: hypothetical protein QNJ88_12930 [Acidimicrobiia bacterium]|nr:hypothetical protein [Acidimicrobiia bacterium]